VAGSRSCSEPSIRTPCVPDAEVTRQDGKVARQDAEVARQDAEVARQDAEVTRRREMVAAFLAAAREGDFEALLAISVWCLADSGPLGARGQRVQAPGSSGIALARTTFE
jgi:hypothetical protein